MYRPRFGTGFVLVVPCVQLISYVDDRTITTSVKAKLTANKVANFTRVDVDTTNKGVALNGIVESSAQKARAEELAMQVSGVRKVDNNLQVQARN